MKETLRKYRDRFSESRFWSNLARFARKAGIKVIYPALLLYYAYERSETPTWAKRIALGALGYLIAPIDMIIDLTPILGHVDDLNVITFSVIAISSYVNDEVRAKARNRLGDWFSDFDASEVEAVDQQIDERRTDEE